MNSRHIMHEWQFDGLVGPTHNYAGLSYGNVASASNAGAVSNPKMAALQGLKKMRYVRNLGMKQSFLPPHYRPWIPALKQIGFEGGLEKILGDAHAQCPELLASVFSSSFMWTANAGTVAPSADTDNRKLHITPANLISHFHRSLEPEFTTQLLRCIFFNQDKFCVHDPLPSTTRFSDEGAANHMRIGETHHDASYHVFVYGFGAEHGLQQRRYPARQNREAYEAVARNHRLPKNQVIHIQQNPAVIDQGVFHNDVIAMNTTRLMIAHEQAFVDAQPLKNLMRDKGLSYINVLDGQLTVEEAVKTYFFNSQMLELPDGNIVILAPSECEEHPRASALLQSLVGSNGPVSAIHYRDVRESMRNGGGPACLRLRIVMSEEEAAAMHQGIVLTDEKYEQLKAWVEEHYRDRLSLEDLRDPAFVNELNTAYEALEGIVGMKGLYTSRMG